MTTARLDLLRLIRDNLAARLSDASDRDVTGLTRQLTDVLQQIEAAEKASAPVKGTPLDELARRRGRGSAPGGGARSAGA